jgi:uncharacterized membrane protein YphA (DoxX/SURF4 family)
MSGIGSHIPACSLLGSAFQSQLRRGTLQRLFSTFPGGWPGVALLLLRVSIGVTSGVQGTFYLAHAGRWTFEALVLCLLLTAGGALLVIGLLTPFASAVVGIVGVGNVIGLIPTPTGNLFDGRLGGFEMIVMAGAIALLGPGGLSIDARLFGRREIVIPAASHPPES